MFKASNQDILLNLQIVSFMVNIFCLRFDALNATGYNLLGLKFIIMLKKV